MFYKICLILDYNFLFSFAHNAGLASFLHVYNPINSRPDDSSSELSAEEQPNSKANVQAWGEQATLSACREWILHSGNVFLPDLLPMRPWDAQPLLILVLKLKPSFLKEVMLERLKSWQDLHRLCTSTSLTTRTNHKPFAELHLWLSFQKCLGFVLKTDKTLRDSSPARLRLLTATPLLPSSDQQHWMPTESPYRLYHWLMLNLQDPWLLHTAFYFPGHFWKKMGPGFQKEKKNSSKKAVRNLEFLKKMNEPNVQHGMHRKGLGNRICLDAKWYF